MFARSQGRNDPLPKFERCTYPEYLISFVSGHTLYLEEGAAVKITVSKSNTFWVKISMSNAVIAEYPCLHLN